ncbi:hypothetical protein AVEN_210164-1, partial [Araneus ventricosus]
DCYTEAFPMSINYWTKSDSCTILQPNEKYSVSISDNIYQVSMKLVITAVDQNDFDSYKCIAKNSLGSTEGVIRLFEAKVSIYNRKEKVDAEEEEEEKSKDDTDTTYRETYEEVRIKDASYELMRNTNTKESRLPKSAHLERQRVSNFITALNGGDCLRDSGAFFRLFIAAVWICHYLSSRLMALK